MKLVVIGTGYVGLVTGSCFAEMGHSVTCIDIDERKISMLKQGDIPIYEPGLQEIVSRNTEAGRLRFTTSYEEAIPLADACFFALPTPPTEEGDADLSYIEDSLQTIAPLLSEYTLLIMKSTIPVGTCRWAKKTMETLSTTADFDVVSNPEFLKEGSAVSDFMKPDRIIVGVENEKSRKFMEKIYSPFTVNHNRIIFMDIPSAELTKYAANAMLATRIAFMNEISVLCEKVGADISQVRIGIGSDERIGYSFLYAGPGFGGSCFPKDIRALNMTAKNRSAPLRILSAVEEANDAQKQVLFRKAKTYYGNLSGKTFALWGLSFKPETDDVRESPALTLLSQLVAAGATVRLYDPVAMETAARVVPPSASILYCKSEFEAAKGADGVFLMTEWKQFRFLDLSRVFELMNNPILFDGRNQYNPEEVRSLGFVYFGIGRKDDPIYLLEELKNIVTARQ